MRGGISIKIADDNSLIVQISPRATEPKTVTFTDKEVQIAIGTIKDQIYRLQDQRNLEAPDPIGKRQTPDHKNPDHYIAPGLIREET